MSLIGTLEPLVEMKEDVFEVFRPNVPAEYATIAVGRDAFGIHFAVSAEQVFANRLIGIQLIDIDERVPFVLFGVFPKITDQSVDDLGMAAQSDPAVRRSARKHDFVRPFTVI